MGRKNRKGRSPRQHPRRRYQPGRHQREADTAVPAVPEDRPTVETDTDPVGSTRPGLQAPVATCGTCREWEPGPDPWTAGGRGRCLHPASGVAFPPPDAAACPYYDR